MFKKGLDISPNAIRGILHKTPSFKITQDWNNIRKRQTCIERSVTQSKRRMLMDASPLIDLGF